MKAVLSKRIYTIKIGFKDAHIISRILWEFEKTIRPKSWFREVAVIRRFQAALFKAQEKRDKISGPGQL